VLEPIHADDLGADAAPLRPHPRIRPELRFQVRDDRGDSWNVVYDLGTGLLDGRPTQEVSSTPTIELLESLHKQHHYPPSFAASSVWALFADLTAITLLFWCLSGLLMWWQMKKLRWVGSSLLVLAVVGATLVKTSTAAEITFPPERAEGPTAPGGAPPGAFAQGLVEASRGVRDRLRRAGPAGPSSALHEGALDGAVRWRVPGALHEAAGLEQAREIREHVRAPAHHEAIVSGVEVGQGQVRGEAAALEQGRDAALVLEGL